MCPAFPYRPLVAAAALLLAGACVPKASPTASATASFNVVGVVPRMS